MNKKIRKIITIVLISTMSIGLWEIGKKQWIDFKDKQKYKTAQENKNSIVDIQEYLEDKGYDWITIPNTAVNYPLVQYTDNDYYTTHDYEGNKNNSGAIFYDASDEPFNGRITTIFGHSMKNGTMFNNLHYFQKDHDRFRNSELIIETEEGTKKYKPLAYYVTADDKFYKQLDNVSIDETIKAIQENSEYFIDGVTYNEDSHIIVLFTCDYSIKDGRLIVFYISE